MMHKLNRQINSQPRSTDSGGDTRGGGGEGAGGLGRMLAAAYQLQFSQFSMIVLEIYLSSIIH